MDERDIWCAFKFDITVEEKKSQFHYISCTSDFDEHDLRSERTGKINVINIMMVISTDTDP